MNVWSVFSRVGTVADENLIEITMSAQSNV